MSAGAAVDVPALDAEARARLGEAAEWRLIGLLFERPRAEWWGLVARLAGEIEDPRLRAAGEAAHDASEGVYLDVLGPGALSARAVAYVPSVQPGLHLARLAAFYEAFAYRPAGEDPPDHLAVQAGFFAYLRFKQAYALANGDAEHAQVTAEAAESFRAEHLVPCAAGVAHALAQCNIEYLRLLGQAVAARVGPPRTRPRPPGADDLEEGCGMNCALEQGDPGGEEDDTAGDAITGDDLEA